MTLRNQRKPLDFLLFLFLVATTLFIPSISTALLDGLPLDGPWEMVSLLVFVMAISTRKIRDSLLATYLKLKSRARIFLLLLLMLFSSARLISAFTDGHSGTFAACYRAAYLPLAGNACEKTFDGVAFGSEVTRYDRVIDFKQLEGYRADTLSGSNWNFSFANDWPRFDVWPWVEGNIDIERFPFSVQWNGTFDFEKPTSVVINYVGEGKLSIGNQVVELPASYSESNAIYFNTVEGEQDIQVDYSFLDTRTVNESNNNPYALIQVADAESGMLLTPLGPRGFGLALGRLLDAASMLLVSYLALGLLRRTLGRLRLVAISGALVTLAIMFSDKVPLPSFAPLLFLTIVCIWAYLIFMAPDALFVVGIPSGVVLAIERVHNFIVTRDGAFPGLNFSIFRLRGDDWLVYQGLGRSILTEWSLRGGEDIYWGQPGFRYVVFLSHIVFGDGDVLIAFAFSALFIISSLVLVNYVVNSEPNFGDRVASAIMGISIVVIAISSRVIEAEYLGLSEYVTWILVIYVFSLLLRDSVGQATINTAVLLCGFCVFVRTNQLFGMTLLVALLVIQGFKKNQSLRKSVFIPSALFLMMVLLPLAHNAYYGKTFVLLPQSAGANSDFSWSELIRVFSDSDARVKAILKFREFTYTAYLSEGFGFSLTLASVFWVFQLGWITSLFQMLRKRAFSASNWIMILWPLAFALPAIPYRLDAYYPRQVLMFNLCLGLSAFAVFQKLRQISECTETEGKQFSGNDEIKLFGISPHSSL